MAVFRAFFDRENRSQAKRAAGSGCDQPLENPHQGGEQDESHRPQGEFVIVDDDRVGQDGNGRGYQNALEAEQQRRDPEA